ncbi:ribonuclease H-like domain-containing protein [Candidatus Sumerlaeota bacterium]|nr:ribonuclease H-like domain-containing protein [Candidatus Sumerlaeota bacterium]
MANEDKQKRILSLLKHQGVFRASDYFAKEEKEKQRYPDITEVVKGARRLQNEYGELIYRQLTVPVMDIFTPPVEDIEYKLPGEKYFHHLNPEVIAKFCGSEDSVAPERLLFLDLETTGLAGGTGTYPILSGVGYFRRGEFVLEQFFMEDFDREIASLTELAKRIDNFTAFVTYNGKSFDIPLLRTRFTLHRLGTELELPNIDLLHLVRRLWRGILPECTLTAVERHLLGIRRTRDVDGSMVPQIYFDFLRRRDPGSIAVVFDHNAQDVISLASILARIVYYYHFPDTEELTEAIPQLGLSKLYERHGESERCLESMERALVYCRDPRLAYFISCHIARLYKRMNRWDEALSIWNSHIESGHLYNLEPFIELAKYFEHRVRDHKKAIQIVERALQFVEETQELNALLGDTLSFDPEKAIDELTYRLRRLQRRRTPDNAYYTQQEGKHNED